MFKKKKNHDNNTPENKDNVAEETKLAGEETPQTEENAQEQAAAEQPELSAEDKLKEELAQANDKYLRLYAEFDNFRRRTTKERVELLQTAGKEVIVSLLPVLDDFERAIKSMETATDLTAIKEGVMLVQNKVKSILGSKGLKEMDARGAAFDADLHEAITNIPAPLDELKGKVVDELEKGYYLNDKVVRFAKVVVGA
ncbi:molecular chaperone GrpE [Mucilaginibacter yixingensis]|uniref:Protein GrpE n=1 Tax=Mucilaginibacter yixingensis TaxID=1295612 RepID=A0A2T5JAS5_9SPHI|nr:nucleotide exchange factor GrpE [Mucilaginibacter yixingensis]PTQ97971.1 molecular chaperone GrpE [Mucilaginibacter yixingensis]